MLNSHKSTKKHTLTHDLLLTPTQFCARLKTVLFYKAYETTP